MPATVWMHATAVKQATTVMPATSTLRITAIQQDRQHSMDAIKSRDACKNIEASNSMEGSQQQQRQQEHHSVSSRRETHNNKDTRICRDQLTTVQASAGMPTTQYGRQQLMSYHGNQPKSHPNREERHKKELKFPLFCLIDFSNSDSYRTIRSPMQLKSDRYVSSIF